MLRLALIGVCAALLLLAGCGAGEPAEPRIERALAQELAGQAREVAALVEGGDVAGARERLLTLRAAAVEAIDAGVVPSELAGPLLQALNDLVLSLPEPAPAEEDKGDEGNGDGNGHGKGKGKSRDEDD